MESSRRVVVTTPLKELWNDDGPMLSSRIGLVNGDQIRELLRCGAIQFVVADVGSPLRWIPPNERYWFWKTEAMPHLTDDEHFRLEDFPDEYAYVAARRTGEPPIIVLEKHH